MNDKNNWFTISRRKFITFLVGAVTSIVGFRKYMKLLSEPVGKQTNVNRSSVFIARNGTPEQNMKKIVEMIGGIHRIIESNAVVILKPNCQWTSYAGTNTNVIKCLIDIILDHPDGFTGEIVIGENVHATGYDEKGERHDRWADEHRGFTTTDRNGDYNIVELVDHYRSKGFSNVSYSEWYTFEPRENPTRAGKVVSSIEVDDGYVHTDIEYYCPENGRTTRMSYPIFTTPNGTKIDFKNGIWNGSGYSDQPLRFINIPVLKDHGSWYAGVTCSIKNYLGIVDLAYFAESNFHFMLLPGIFGAVGTFMKTIRMADLNIVDATWVQVDELGPTFLNTNLVLGGVDPVALDYFAAKQILFPLSRNPAHNPDDSSQAFARQLQEIQKLGIGSLGEKGIRIKSYDFPK